MEGAAAFIDKRKPEFKDVADGQIIVTGASRGIGASIALELQRRGYAVAGTSRAGDTAVGPGYACEMTDEAAIVRTIRGDRREGADHRPRQQRRRLRTGPSAKLTAAVFEQHHPHQRHVGGVGFARGLSAPEGAGGGLIVNIGSFFDKLGVAEHVAYCASKAAIAAITRCLAVEWAADDIRVIERGARLHRDRLQPRLPRRQGSGRGCSKRVPVRARARRRRSPRLVARCSPRTSASSPARRSTSTAARG